MVTEGAHQVHDVAGGAVYGRLRRTDMQTVIKASIGGPDSDGVGGCRWSSVRCGKKQPGAASCLRQHSNAFPPTQGRSQCGWLSTGLQTKTMWEVRRSV